MTTDTAEAPATPRNASDDDRSLEIDPSAVQRVQALREREGDGNLMLRVAVDGGGCSGFQYRFGFATELEEDDLLFERDGIQVVCDDVSLDLLSGSTVRFKRDLMGAMFVVDNPNASSGCGCGTSFSIAM